MVPDDPQIGEKIFYILVDPPCLCLQEVVSEVQGNESEIMHTLAGVF